MAEEKYTYTGQIFDYRVPERSSICIEDIAHSLALTGRFGGHTVLPYSVAEHSVRAAHAVIGVYPIIALLHDATEAYVGDVITPLKSLMEFRWGRIAREAFKNYERRVLTVIGEALEIPSLATHADHVVIKAVDQRMFATEVRDLMSGAARPLYDHLVEGVVPYRDPIRPWPWQKAERKFLQHYKEWTNGQSKTI
jgi:hypothetical protein